MILAFLVSIFGAVDSFTASSLYRQLELKNPIKFIITKKYNKDKSPIFPNSNYYGFVIASKEVKEIKISRGDFDKHSIGDTIIVFKSKSGERFMTQYEIDNHNFIKVFGQSFSFVIIPAAIFFFIGTFILINLIRKGRKKADKA